MRYATWSDVVARYPSLARIAQAEETAIEANFIAGAEGEVDAALAARYTVPVATTPTLAPALVRDVTIDLAYYKAAFLSLEEEPASRLYKYIQDRLKGLSAGSMALVSSGGSVTTTAAVGAYSTVTDYTNITGVDAVENWAVSSLELLAEESRRDW